MAELIAKLATFPAHLPVCVIYDGSRSREISAVWVARGDEDYGPSVTLWHGGAVYYTEDRPADAPREEENSYWKPPLPSRIP